MTVFEVDRSKWRCGKDNEGNHGEGNTLLLNKQGYMCCLGFCCDQLGIENLLWVACPSEINTTSVFSRGYNKDTELSVEAITINDSDKPRINKERELERLFEEYGCRISFYGKYEDED